jgi:hypothetical protein
MTTQEQILREQIAFSRADIERLKADFLKAVAPFVAFGATIQRLPEQPASAVVAHRHNVALEVQHFRDLIALVERLKR